MRDERERESERAREGGREGGRYGERTRERARERKRARVRAREQACERERGGVGGGRREGWREVGTARGRATLCVRVHIGVRAPQCRCTTDRHAPCGSLIKPSVQSAPGNAFHPGDAFAACHRPNRARSLVSSRSHHRRLLARLSNGSRAAIESSRVVACFSRFWTLIAPTMLSSSSSSICLHARRHRSASANIAGLITHSPQIQNSNRGERLGCRIDTQALWKE